MTGNDLSRFLEAQEPVLEQVTAELRAGRKRSHWMWFVFPQIAGLGRSATARFYALQDLQEARAYLAQPVLGARLRTCIRLLLAHAGRPAAEILGEIDAAKLRSCLTLFLQAARDPADRELFQAALDAFHDGRQDAATLRILAEPQSAGG